MNKKFLKSLAALFAVAVLGVSCSSNTNPDGDGTPQKKVVTLAQVQAAIRTLATVDAGSNKGTIDFAQAEVTKGATVAVIAKKGSSSLTANDLKAALKRKVDALTLDNTTVANNLNTGFTGSTDQNPRTFTITFTAKEGYSFEGFTSGVSGKALTITVSATPKDTDGSTAASWE